MIIIKKYNYSRFIINRYSQYKRKEKKRKEKKGKERKKKEREYIYNNENLLRWTLSIYKYTKNIHTFFFAKRIIIMENIIYIIQCIYVNIKPLYMKIYEVIFHNKLIDGKNTKI